MRSVARRAFAVGEARGGGARRWAMYRQGAPHPRFASSFTLPATLKEKLLAGCATSAGTKAFIASSSLPMYHEFQASKLFINPIIHGPPPQFLMVDTELVSTEEQGQSYMAQALLRHRSNCIYVYQHREGLAEWGSLALRIMLEQPEKIGNIKREEVVAVAGLGRAASLDVMKQRLFTAHLKSGLLSFDLLVFEFDDAVFDSNPDCVTDCIDWLENLCKEKIITSYGVQMSFAPYHRHTPPTKMSGKYQMHPQMLEMGFALEAPNLDLVMYSISPTSAIPATYPMLSPDIEKWDESLEQEETPEEKKKSMEGIKALINEKMKEELELAAATAGGEGGGKEQQQLQAGEEQAEDEDIDDYLGDLPSEDTRIFSRAAVDPFICKRGQGVANVREEDMSEEETLKRVEQEINEANIVEEMGESENKDEDNYEGKVHLVDDLVSVSLKNSFQEALDSLCPPLKSTPRLQDKALRIAFSVGVEAVVVDAESSAHMGKLAVTTDDLLSSEATNDVFGQFMLPLELINRRLAP